MMEDGIPYVNEPRKPRDSHSPQDLHNIAKFLNLDSDLWTFRRFGKLHLLTLLILQRKLIALEDKLEAQIAEDVNDDFDALLTEIQDTLKKYDEALSAQAKFKSYRPPEARVLTHMENWASTALVNGWHLVDALRISQLGSRSRIDLASIALDEKSWTHRFIDDHPRLLGLLINKSSPEQLSSSLIYSEDLVRRAEAVFIHACFCLLLICPVIGMSYLSSKGWKLLLLGLSLLAASFISVGFLNAPNKSGLALVAGYAAILVVFMTNESHG